MLHARLTHTELSLKTTGNATTQLFHPALALPFSLLRASGSSPPGLLLWEQKPQKRRSVFIQQLTAFLFIGNTKIYIPCSMHGRKKGELSQGHTGGSLSGSSLILGLQKLHKTEEEKRERTKELHQNLKGEQPEKKTLFGKRASKGTGVPQSWGETSKKLYRRREGIKIHYFQSIELQ